MLRDKITDSINHYIYYTHLYYCFYSLFESKFHFDTLTPDDDDDDAIDIDDEVFILSSNTKIGKFNNDNNTIDSIIILIIFLLEKLAF